MARIPTVKTTAVTQVTSNSITCGGNVSSAGGLSVLERGIVYGCSSYSTAITQHTHDGTGTGNYTTTIEGLAPNTKYYLRPYATNALGTGYGAQLIFMTLPIPVTTTTTTKINVSWIIEFSNYICQQVLK